MADTPQLFRLNIEVGDLGAAQKFYETLLGTPGRGQAGGRFYINAGPVAFQVVQTPSPHKAAKALYFTVIDLDAIHARDGAAKFIDRHGARTQSRRDQRQTVGRALVLCE